MNYKILVFGLTLFIFSTIVLSASLNQIKAVFLINFFHYTSWSKEAFSTKNPAINLCLIADNEFRQLLELTVKDKLIDGKKIIVQSLTPKTPPELCQLLFISQSKTEKIPVYIPLVNTLIISDIANSIHHGAMIELRTINRKVKLFINLKLIKQANLSINSRLLSLATIVEKE